MMSSTGIHIEDGEDINVSGNTIKGFDKGIVAKRVKKLEVKGNTIIENIEPNNISDKDIEELKALINNLNESNSQINTELKEMLDGLKNEENSNIFKSTFKSFISTLIASQASPENIGMIFKYLQGLVQ